jgi:hypothetical protein
MLESLVLPDPLEFARGALCALSFTTSQHARETHIKKLRNQFEQAGLTMRNELKTLQLLREAEELAQGYWILTPVRVVELNDKYFLLVAPQPTAELKRHFPSVSREGAGHVVNQEEGQNLPKQTLSAWRGSDGYDANTWASFFVDSSMKQLARSFVSDNLTVFGTKLGRPEWMQPDDSEACTWHGVSVTFQRECLAISQSLQ